MDFTACYTKIESGFMGQLLEWPQVITEGATLDECRAMLTDAAQEMFIVCREDGTAVPSRAVTVERISIPMEIEAAAYVG